jgi:hypothetical protein
MRGIIEFDFDECVDREFAEEYIKTINQMLYMFHFVDGVTKADIQEDAIEYLVDYNDCYAKSIRATSEDEARRLVLDEKQGDTLYFTQRVNKVEVKR